MRFAITKNISCLKKLVLLSIALVSLLAYNALFAVPGEPEEPMEVVVGPVAGFLDAVRIDAVRNDDDELETERLLRIRGIAQEAKRTVMETYGIDPALLSPEVQERMKNAPVPSIAVIKVINGIQDIGMSPAKWLMYAVVALGGDARTQQEVDRLIAIAIWAIKKAPTAGQFGPIPEHMLLHNKLRVWCNAGQYRNGGIVVAITPENAGLLRTAVVNALAAKAAAAAMEI